MAHLPKTTADDQSNSHILGAERSDSGIVRIVSRLQSSRELNPDCELFMQCHRGRRINKTSRLRCTSLSKLHPARPPNRAAALPVSFGSNPKRCHLSSTGTFICDGG